MRVHTIKKVPAPIKMNGLRVQRFKVGDYPIRVEVWMAKDNKRAWPKFKELFTEPEDNYDSDGDDGEMSAEAFTCTKKTGHVGIMFRWNPSVEVMVHECFHAVSFVLVACGIDHVDETEEAYAYSMGMLAQNVQHWVASMCKGGK